MRSPLGADNVLRHAHPIHLGRMPSALLAAIVERLHALGEGEEGGR